MSKQERRCLIVKTSSYGDILQSLNVIKYLKEKHSDYKIDWVVEKRCLNLLQKVDGLDEIIICDFEKTFWCLKSLFKNLRKRKYDVIFDLQGNCKSGLITFLARAFYKVGFSRQLVREWPNLLATNLRFSVDIHSNVKEQYLNLVKAYFRDTDPFLVKEIILKGANTERINKKSGVLNIMICPFSKWPQKMLSKSDLFKFVQLIQQKYDPNIFFVYGSEEEEKQIKTLFSPMSERIFFIGNLSFSVWQEKMFNMDMVITVDSCSLALCGISDVYSFAIFGPTKKTVLMPLGGKSFAFQAHCPYGEKYIKVCPKWRKCAFSCLAKVDVEELFSCFSQAISCVL